MTLFLYPKYTLDRFKNDYKLDLTSEFLSCADNQLSEIFIKKTGLKFSKNLCLSWVNKNIFFYERGEVSKLPFSLYVNHNWNDIFICWKSKSGRIYEISDNNIDCSDIVFSFENLEVDLYVKQLYPNQQLPFKISDLSYELIVTRLNLDATFKLSIKSQFIMEQDEITKSIYDFIDTFNSKSEKNNRKDGVIHNTKAIYEQQTIILEMDLGSTGILFLKKFLKFLNSIDKFSKVEIE